MLLFRNGQHAASRELYEALVQNFPNFMDALSNFGLALVKLSQVSLVLLPSAPLTE